MSVSCNPEIKMRTSESFSADGVAGNTVLSFSEYDRTSGTYNASSTVPATKVAADALALVAGAATIDLTAVPGKLAGTTVDFTGLEPIVAMFVNPSTNAGAYIDIAKGASNGYSFQNNETIRVYKGGRVFLEFAGGLGAVGAGAKNLDVSGTGTDTLKYIIVG